MAESADVRILISAITEAAEESIDDVGQSLAETSVDAGVAQAGLDEVGDELNAATTRSGLLQGALGELADDLRDTIPPAALLQSQLDEVGDESTEAAAKAGIASGAFTTLSLSTDGAALSMGTLSSALTVALLPALTLLVTTLAPVAGALGVAATAAAGLAGALGLVVGSGAVAGMDRLSAAFERSKTEIQGVVSSFGEEFVPLLRQGITALPSLVKNVLSAAGSMAPFKRALRDAGAVAFEVLPKIVAFFFDLARTALPYARELAGFLLNNARPAFMAMVSATAELESEFRSLLGSIVEFGPALLRFGTLAASVVLPAVTALIRGTSLLFNVLSDPPAGFAPALSRAAASLSRLQTALQPLYGQLQRLAPELLTLGATVVSVTARMATAAVPVLTRIVSAVTDAAQWFNQLSPQVRRAAVAAGVLVAALGPTLSILGSVAGALSLVLSPIGLVKGAIGGLYVAWRTNLFGIRDVTTQAFAALKPAFQRAIGLVRSFVPTLSQLSAVWDTHGGTVLAVVRTARNAIVAAFGAAMSFLRTDVPATLQYLGTLWNTHGGTVLAVARRIRTAVVSTLGTAVAFLRTNIPAALTKVAAVWRTHRGTVLAIVRELGQLIRVSFMGSLKALRTVSVTVLSKLNALWDRHRGQVSAAVTAASVALSTLLKRIQQIVTPIQRWSVTLKTADTRLLGLAKTARSQANASLSTLSNTIRSLLLPALGAGLLGAIGLLATAFRGKLATAATFVGGKLAGLVVGSTRLTKAVDRLRGVGSKAAGLFRNKIGTALLFVQGKFLGLAKTILGRLFPVFSRVGGVVSRIAGLLGGKLLGTVVRVGGRFASLALTAGRVGGALSLLTNPIGIAVAAIAGLYLAWKKNLFGIRDKTKRILDAVKAAFRGDTSKMKGIVRDAVGQIRGTWGKLQALWQDTKRILRKVGKVALAALRWLQKNAVQPVLRSIRKQWDRHGQQIMDSVGQLFNFLKGLFKVALGTLMVIWDKWGNEIRQATKFIFDVVGSVINTGLDVVLTAFDVVTDFMAGEWETGLNKILDLGKRIFGGIINFVRKWGSGFLSYISNDLVGGVIGFFQDLARRLIGGSIIPEMFSSITDAAKTFVSDLIGEFKTLVSDTLGKFDELKGKAVGKIIDLGNRLIGRGRELKNKVGAKFKQLKDDALDFLGTLVGKGVGKIIDLGNRMIGRARELKNKVVGKFNKLKDEAIGKVSEMAQTAMDWLTGEKGPLSNVKGAGESLIGSFINGIESKMGDVGDAVDSIVQEARDKLPGSDAKEGPLSDLTAAGRALPETVAKGMVRGTRTARQAASRVAEAARPSLAADARLGVSGPGMALWADRRSRRQDGGGDTIYDIVVQVDLSGSATRQDGRDAADGFVSQLRTYNLDRF